VIVCTGVLDVQCTYVPLNLNNAVLCALYFGLVFQVFPFSKLNAGQGVVRLQGPIQSDSTNTSFLSKIEKKININNFCSNRYDMTSGFPKININNSC
jgi:hypothetical protein